MFVISLSLRLFFFVDKWHQNNGICLSSNWNIYRRMQWHPHSSTLAWEIPWMEEAGRLQFMGSLRVGHNWATSLALSRIGEGNGNPVQCSCLENPRDRGARWAAVCGVAQSRTRLKRLSSSSSRDFPGSSVVKNLPCNSEDAGSIPGWETKIPHALEQLSSRTRTTESTHHN